MGTFTKIIIIYYIVINIILFILMGVDKLKAQKESWRIPEANLFVIALLGGGVGGFAGMFLFHHKNRKPHFYIIYGLSLVLHFALAYLVFFKK